MTIDYSREDVTVLRSDTSVSKSWSIDSASGAADAPRVLKQRFVLEEKLGSGGMGTVFRAKDLRKVEARDRQPFLAVKVLNNDFREHPEAFVALQREATKSQSVSHPNIVSIYDFDKDGDLPFITMEILEGQELADLLRAYPDGLPDTMAWEVIRGMCAGLRHAHKAGVVHADFKPGNVFVSSQNTAKILDFGIARAVQLTESAGEDTLFDPARLAALTPAYASREMINGDNPETRDDLYSLGIVLYLILTGHHPYGRLPADDAARENLRPEKPRRLSHRQWRVLRKCLAFNRQDRPADMAEVERLLFSPSPWRSRSAIAAAAAFAMALGISLLVEDAELNTVKQEVRHNTLIDSQVARIAALLDDPRFDDNWELQLDEELTRLRGLDGAQQTAAELSTAVRAAYTQRIAASDSLDDAVDLFARGGRFGPLTEAEGLVMDRAFVRMNELLDREASIGVWYADLEQELVRLRTLFPVAHRVAEIELEVADVLEQRIRGDVSELELAEARHLLEDLENVVFDMDVLEETRHLVDTAAEEVAQAEALRRREEALAATSSALDELLDASCLRLDLAPVAEVYASLVGSSLADSARERVDTRVTGCLQQLAELDQSRAVQLQAQTRALFGETLAAARATSVDPCRLSYLVGNGAQTGRGGYCADAVGDGGTGPRLVVLPATSGAGRFAMTKHEVTWANFKTFCLETASCEIDVANESLPVTGVSVATAQAYADWLTLQTGFHYRLPTAEEWRWAARGAPDPNRNCRVQLDGVQRGLAPVVVTSGRGNDFGLVHMLGNVQEWVLDSNGISAIGGAYSDPIQDCVVQTSRGHGGDGDANTGFRLVREIS